MAVAHAPHPGEHIRSDCLAPLGLTVTAGAKALGISRKTLSELVNGRAGISPEMALRLGKVFGTPARHWMQLQMDYDLWQVERRAPELDVGRFHRDAEAEMEGREPSPTATPPEGERTTLPEHLRQYFWDQDPSQLSLEENRYSIVKRLIESGGWDAVQWLRAHLEDSELETFLVRRSGRGISPKRLRFWALLLHLPPEQVTEWIDAQRSHSWSRRVRQ